jgi:hypothetical protein
MNTRSRSPGPPSPAIATGNHQIIAGGDTAGDRLDQVVNDLDRKPMLAASNTLGYAGHIRTNSIPPAYGIGP